jgi:hypothetical protein
MYLLNFDSQKKTYYWSLLKNAGKKPAGRFGHSLTFMSPYLVFFGGNDGLSAKNDFWRLDLS